MSSDETPQPQESQAEDILRKLVYALDDASVTDDVIDLINEYGYSSYKDAYSAICAARTFLERNGRERKQEEVAQ